MFVLGIIFFVVCALCLLMASAYFCLYLLFEKKTSSTDKTLGKLIRLKHKKNVPVYGRRRYNGPIRVVMILKDLSKGRYEYTVDGKKYRVRLVELSPANEMPLMADVIYLKRFPKIAYVKTITNSHKFEVYSFGALMFAVLMALFGADCVF